MAAATEFLTSAYFEVFKVNRERKFLMHYFKTSSSKIIKKLHVDKYSSKSMTYESLLSRKNGHFVERSFMAKIQKAVIAQKNRLLHANKKRRLQNASK